ncbi:MAG: hypothetical protein OHK005_14750 [Candidatus Methylacidiphilales bacterium]
MEVLSRARGRAAMTKLHRRLGLGFCLFTLVAAGSGLVHNIMSWTQPAPPRPVPGGRVALGRVSVVPSELADKLGDESKAVTAVVLREIGGEPWYQVYQAGRDRPAYIHAGTGVRDDGVDLVYAREIASRHLGGVQVRHTATLTAFDREYIEIFRILPVERFDADDGLGTRVYVSTMTGTVTRHTDNHRQLQATLFALFHKFAFIPDKNVRNAFLSITTGGIFLVALSGLVLFLVSGRRTRHDRQKSEHAPED